jgi:phage baseplate assembly protein W
MAVIKRVQAVTQKSSVDVIYSDFYNNFDIHPNKKDLVSSTNEDSVKNSIRNLLLTDKGEKLFNPLYGSNIRALLFENVSPQSESLLREYITNSIENYEPRAQLIEVYVSALPDENAYNATVIFSVINNSQPVVLELILDRVR